MKYYEILNKETLEKAQGVAESFQAMCEALDWRPQDCRLIWKAKPGKCRRSRSVLSGVFASQMKANICSNICELLRPL
jgi:hypothetical protein